MKKSIILILVLCLAQNIRAEETGKNVLVDGRVWNYIMVFWGDEKNDTTYHSYTAKGPVEFDNRLCYNVGGTMFYEEGNCLYSYSQNPLTGEEEWRKELDFNLSLDMDNVLSIDSILINDQPHRRINLVHDVWVEGIGSKGCGVFGNWGIVPGTFLDSQVTSVYDGDECIFTADDFTKPSYTSTEEYFPEGTKWTEIRLDTLKYDSWYSKVGDEWVPNFETIEYYVKGEFIDKDRGDGKDKFRCVYTNGPEWTDSLALMIEEEGDAEYVEQNSVMVSVLVHDFDGKSYLLSPGMAYQFDWSVGKDIHYLNICSSNLTGWFSNPETFGTIEEIKEGKFGGETPLKYVDLNGVRIIQGIGITEWNDGECLFGPTNPYEALSMYEDYRADLYPERHYRSMLVHFERNGEVLYDVWPEKGITDGIKSVNKEKVPSPNTIYDLQGRRMQQAPQKGIYIQNGTLRARAR